MDSCTNERCKKSENYFIAVVEMNNKLSKINEELQEDLDAKIRANELCRTIMQNIIRERADHSAICTITYHKDSQTCMQAKLMSEESKLEVEILNHLFLIKTGKEFSSNLD